MAKQLITIGTPGAGGGDPAHVAFKKINDNATELYDAAIPDTEEKKTQARADLGLGTAATKNVGTAAGNVMGVGAFGLGLTTDTPYLSYTSNLSNLPNGLYGLENGGHSGILIRQTGSTGLTKLGILGFPSDSITSAPFYYRLNLVNGATLQQNQAYRHTFYTTQNAAVDANGFIKSASPIANLYADKIELNNEAQLQDITFEKLNVGDYLVKGSLGFAQSGWYIEMPKDANGNVLVAVVYEQLENNDISVKTYAKKFDDETGDIVANLDKPRDIPAGRWIDLRLQELPQPEIQIPESIAPPDFQPTNLAQAVAEALNNGSE